MSKRKREVRLTGSLPWRRPIGLDAVVASTVLLVALVLAARPARADAVVHLYYFYDPLCITCPEVQREVIEPLAAEFGSRVAIDQRNMGEAANYRLMIGLEEMLGVTDGNIPEVVIGDRVLVGADAIRDELRDLVIAHLDRGGVDLPVPPEKPPMTPTPVPCLCELIAGSTSVDAAPVGSRIVRAALFWSKASPQSDTLFSESLPPILDHYAGKLDIVAFDVSLSPNHERWTAAMDARAVPPEKRTVPMMFVGDDTLIGSEQIAGELAGTVDRYLVFGGRDLPEGLGTIDVSVQPTMETAAERPPSVAPFLGLGVGLLIVAGSWAMVRRGWVRRKAWAPEPSRPSSRRSFCRWQGSRSAQIHYEQDRHDQT